MLNILIVFTQYLTKRSLLVVLPMATFRTKLLSLASKPSINVILESQPSFVRINSHKSPKASGIIRIRIVNDRFIFFWTDLEMRMDDRLEKCAPSPFTITRLNLSINLLCSQPSVKDVSKAGTQPGRKKLTRGTSTPSSSNSYFFLWVRNYAYYNHIFPENLFLPNHSPLHICI